jgi:truncated hemoglobin YjbI
MLRKLTKKSTKINIGKGCPLSSAHSEEYPCDHSIQRLEKRACELSGIELEKAKEIDEYSLANQLGEFTLTTLYEKFYAKVLEDKDDWFRDMFQSSIEDLIANESEYLIQRLGGPSYYTDRKGIPSLIKMHYNVEMTPRTAEKWLEYMETTLEEMVSEIDEPTRDVLMAYFRFSAYFMIASQEASAVMVKFAHHDRIKQEFELEADMKI